MTRDADMRTWLLKGFLSWTSFHHFGSLQEKLSKLRWKVKELHQFLTMVIISIHDIVHKGVDFVISFKLRSINPVLPPLDPVTSLSSETDTSNLRRVTSFSSLSSIDDHEENIPVNFRDSI